MSKAFLMIIGLGLLLMGIAGVIPGWELATEPVWHAIVKIAVGVIALIVVFADKKKGTTTPQA